MATILWHIEISHYNEKARWALDYKSIPHERRAPLPGLHAVRALALTHGKQRVLPVLELEGRRIGDSTAIIAALEQYRPDPPLYPAEPAERERALALEDFFDEQLAPHVRRYVFHYTLGDPDATIDAVMPKAGAGRQRLLRTLAPVARPIVRRDYDVNESSAAHAREKILAAAERVEAELQPSGYLVGERFSVADLTAAALFTPLLCPPERPYPARTIVAQVQEFRDELRARPAGQWVTDMYARHRGVSAEVGA